MNDELRPDRAEYDAVLSHDDAVPTRGYQLLPMVGLGGSAGSIPALQAFFESIPPDTGMAFVVIMHLSPEHESLLAELLQRSTRMPVIQVQDTERVVADTVYVIPPRKSLQTLDGSLRLADMVVERGRHTAVDMFFRTLADTHGPHSTAIVLSGVDGDGAIGIKRIKERGGLTIAQDPDEAQHSGMPRSAIATGMVDWVLPVGSMAERLLAYRELEQRIQLPPEEGPPTTAQPQPTRSASEAALRDVLAFLRTRSGRDFGSYKRATVLRRIGRRMQVNGVTDLSGYLDCLRTRPGEAGALLQDLLISVTNFFRDIDCFAALQARIPVLFADKRDGDTVRVWVAGCATGEEAYSIAMLLIEHAHTLETPPLIQVFATDLDEAAVRVAREGVYPVTIEGDVSEERLRRFFVKEHRGYRVRREVRESVLFAVHDLLKDSPFSRLDLVSCRNLLIYLNRDAQERALDTFHFALRPGGLLFLGASETVDDGSPLYDLLDKKHRLYAQRPVLRNPLPLPSGPGTLTLALAAQAAHEPVMPGSAFQLPPAMLAGRAARAGETRSAALGEIHLRLLEQLAPPSVLVNGEYDIVHLSPGAGRFLRYGGGEPNNNLLRAVSPDLRIELRAALSRAAQGGEPVEVRRVPVELDGQPVEVSLRVLPADAVLPGLLLVTLLAEPPDAEMALPLGPVPLPRGLAGEDPVARQLDRELELLKAHLRDTVEQYEASTEELKASNEELQAMNEELRSATEELETSREELQSINEELTTVNAELKHKVDELGHANSDMHNLMDATAIATVFLDRELRITRYTPAAVTLFNLIPSDVGRPLADLRTRLAYEELGPDAQRVLDRLVPVEREIGEDGGRWFIARLLPYRTLDDRIAGLVLTFVDISERKQVQQALETSRNELREALADNERARAALVSADAAKDRFLAVLSHELRTPLTPVLTAVHMLSRRDDLPEPVCDALEMIRRNIRTEAHLIDDLLDLTRITRGTLEIARERVDLHVVVQAALTVCEDDMAARQQQLTVALDATRHHVTGDPDRLQQVVWNLLKNACKFTPAQGAISVRSSSDARHLHLTVSDTGVGIDAAALPRVFEAFVQEGDWVKREYGGMGLGLAISKAAVDAHGGSLSASSAGRGQGATFVLELPLEAP